MLKRIWWVGVVCIAANAGAQSVQGTIVDALNGMPIEGATVAVLERSISTKTDLHGGYRLSPVPPGTYTLRADVEGYIKNTKKIILTSPHEVGASDLEIDMKLYPRSSDAQAAGGVMTVKYFFPGHANVSITIYDAEGGKVRRVFDRSRRGGMRSYAWDGKDDNGEYVPAGEYSARIACRTMTMMRKLVWEGMKEENSKSEIRNPNAEDTEENPQSAIPDPQSATEEPKARGSDGMRASDTKTEAEGDIEEQGEDRSGSTTEETSDPKAQAGEDMEEDDPRPKVLEEADSPAEE